MPRLSECDVGQLQKVAGGYCDLCDSHTRQNYCRQCDEFCQDGHKPSCPLYTNHEGHRKELCLSCGERLWQSYCHECRGLFEGGHTPGCAREPKEHKGHTRVDSVQI